MKPSKNKLSESEEEVILNPLTNIAKFTIQQIHQKYLGIWNTSRKKDKKKVIKFQDFQTNSVEILDHLSELLNWSLEIVESANYIEKRKAICTNVACILERLQNVTIPNCRLPWYDVPRAVEVLATKTMCLPSCVREQILPRNTIAPFQKKQTISRLHQIIKHRLISSILSPKMTDFKIKNGCLTFIVKNEFKITLTVLGDDEPWLLLDLDILVTFSKIEKCKPQLDPIQLRFLKQFVQSHLNRNVHPFQEIYNCLHYFCQSLKLDVIFLQSSRLENEILCGKISVQQYIHGEKITIAYWQKLADMEKSTVGYRLMLQPNARKTRCHFTVEHVPPLNAIDTTEFAKHILRPDYFSIKRVILHTIHMRSFSRLRQLKLHFQLSSGVECELRGIPAYLKVPVVTRSWRNDNLYIASDTYSGIILCHLPNYTNCPIMNRMQQALNRDQSKVGSLILELRFWLIFQHSKKTLQHLPVTITNKLTFLNQTNHSLLIPSAARIFVKFHRHPNVILVVQLTKNEHIPYEIECDFLVAFVTYQSRENNLTPKQPTRLANMQYQGAKALKIYAHIESLIQLDPSLLTTGSFTKVCDQIIVPKIAKPKSISRAYIIPEIAYVVSICDEQMPFFYLLKALNLHGVPNTGLQFDRNTGSIVLKLLMLKVPRHTYQRRLKSYGLLMPSIEKHVWEDLTKRVISICIRSKWNEVNYCWIVEIVFNGAPLPSLKQPDSDARHVICLSYKQISNAMETVKLILKDWSKIVYLYTIVYDLAKIIKNNEHFNILKTITIHTYNYLNLIIGYGPSKKAVCDIYWCPDMTSFRLVFAGDISKSRAHTLMREKLECYLNITCSLIYLVYMLDETYVALGSISKLRPVPFTMVTQLRLSSSSFMIKLETPTTILLTYKLIFGIQIFLKSKFVVIRDYAVSRAGFNQRAASTVIQGLEVFLSKYTKDNNIISIVSTNGSSTNSVNSKANVDNGKSKKNSSTVTYIILTHAALDRICSPSSYFNKDLNASDISALERFLGCEHLRLQLQNILQRSNRIFVKPLHTTEPRTLLFHISDLQCRVMLNPVHMQSLRLKLTRLTNRQPFQLSDDNILILERFFETRVAIPPYHCNALIGFLTLLIYCPSTLLNHFAELMRLEMYPKVFGKYMKCTVKLCMEAPTKNAVVPENTPGVHLFNKCVLVFFLQITRMHCNTKGFNKTQNIILPLAYNLSTNQTRLIKRTAQKYPELIIKIVTIVNYCSYYAEFRKEHSLIPAISGILNNLHIFNKNSM